MKVNTELNANLNGDKLIKFADKPVGDDPGKGCRTDAMHERSPRVRMPRGIIRR